MLQPQGPAQNSSGDGREAPFIAGSAGGRKMQGNLSWCRARREKKREPGGGKGEGPETGDGMWLLN